MCSCLGQMSRLVISRQLDIIFHFEFLWPAPYKLCSTVESVIKTYLSKLCAKYTIARRRVNAAQVGYKTEVLSTARRNYFGSGRKMARRTWTTKGRNRILPGKLSGPPKEAVNRRRNYRRKQNRLVFLFADQTAGTIRYRVTLLKFNNPSYVDRRQISQSLNRLFTSALWIR